MRFTKHASFRLFERLSINRTDVFRLIRFNKYITIGKEKNREHWLMFSEKDSLPFVLVVDVKMNEVVTVLYTEHQGRCAVSDEAILEVRQLTMR